MMQVFMMVLLFLAQRTGGLSGTTSLSCSPRLNFAVRMLSLKHSEENRSQQLAVLTIPALKHLLRDAGLPVSGLKSVLIQRLMSNGEECADRNTSVGLPVGPASKQTTPASLSPTKKANAPRFDARLSIPRDLTERRSSLFDKPANTLGASAASADGSDLPGGEVLRAVSWNVNGLRAVLSKRAHCLSDVLRDERPHVLCLQETKLQEVHVADCEQAIRALAGELGLEYDMHWSCSTTKKGYSGVAVLVDKARLPRDSYSVHTGLGDQLLTPSSFSNTAAFSAEKDASSSSVGLVPEAEDEGRVLTISWPPRGSVPQGGEKGDGDGRDAPARHGAAALSPPPPPPLSPSWGLSLVAAYVPNSGEGLKRLKWRTEVWDPGFARHCAALQRRHPHHNHHSSCDDDDDDQPMPTSSSSGTPSVQALGAHVLVCGDLNVAHRDEDFFNPEEKRMQVQSGTTPEERSSFARYLLSEDHGIEGVASDLPRREDAEEEKEEGKEEERALSTGQQQQGAAGRREETAGLHDTFRWIHGADTKGVYSYWSMRSRNRPLNRGLRIDYFLCNRDLAEAHLADAFILDDAAGSDHCPVGVHLSVPDGFFAK